MLNIIFGGLKPKHKLVRIDNAPILKPLYKTNLVAYLPQQHFIPNRLKTKTVFKLLNVSWDNFVADFKLFEEFKNINFNKLSGGEKRVIEIYLILKRTSKIILLDEPFSHVAPLYIEKIKTLINQEKKDKSIIITDHMYQYIVNVSDDIYLIKKQ